MIKIRWLYKPLHYDDHLTSDTYTRCNYKAEVKQFLVIPFLIFVQLDKFKAKVKPGTLILGMLICFSNYNTS